MLRTQESQFAACRRLPRARTITLAQLNSESSHQPCTKGGPTTPHRTDETPAHCVWKRYKIPCPAPGFCSSASTLPFVFLPSFSSLGLVPSYDHSSSFSWLSTSLPKCLPNTSSFSSPSPLSLTLPPSLTIVCPTCSRPLHLADYKH